MATAELEERIKLLSVQLYIVMQDRANLQLKVETLLDENRMLRKCLETRIENQTHKWFREYEKKIQDMIEQNQYDSDGDSEDEEEEDEEYKSVMESYDTVRATSTSVSSTEQSMENFYNQSERNVPTRVISEFKVTNDTTVSLVCGNPLLVPTDCLVAYNPSSTVMNSGSGGAKKKPRILKNIERVGGGSQVQKEYEAYEAENGVLQPGEIFVGTGGNIKSDYLIRFVTPEQDLDTEEDITMHMRKMMVNVLEAANEKGVASVTFVPFTGGGFGVHPSRWLTSTKVCFSIALQYLHSGGASTSIKDIKFVFERDQESEEAKLELENDYDEWCKSNNQAGGQLQQQQQHRGGGNQRKATDIQVEEKKKIEALAASLDPKDYYTCDIEELYNGYVEEEDNESNIQFVSMDGVDVASATSTDEHKAAASFAAAANLQSIKCATLGKLIERLTYHTAYDNTYLYAFLLTYRSFITPQQFMDLLIQRYNIPPPRNCTKEQFAEFKLQRLDPIRLRVCQVLRYWMEKHWYDFDADLAKRLEDFINNTMMKTKMEATGKNLLKILDRKRNETDDTERQGQFSTPCPKPLLPTRAQMLRAGAGGIDVLDWPSKEIARQLTLIDSHMFSKIQPKECLNQSWNKENREQRAPNIFGMIVRFNQVSRWAAAQVVKDENIKNRAKVLAKLIAIAQECEQLHNFNAIFEIISGLNCAAIHRLKKTWEALPQKSREVYDQLNNLISRDNNFRNIRRGIVNCSPPTIPYIGLYLTDLTFIDDGNPNELHGLINFTKRRKLASVIRDLQTYQQGKYHLQEVPELKHALLNLEHYDEEETYNRSLMVEARTKRNTVVVGALE